MKTKFFVAYLFVGRFSHGATLIFNTSDGPGDGEGSWTLSRPSLPSNPSFLTGYTINPDAPFPYPIIEYRAHLSFSISGIAAPIQSAVLLLSQQAGYDIAVDAGTVTLGLFDVSTDAVTLNMASGVQPAIFDDLGTGISYGTAPVSLVHNISRVVEIPLNQAAIAAMQNGAVFSIGMRVLEGDGSQDHYLFGNSGLAPNPFVHELRVTTVPEPSCTMLLAVALLFQSWRRRAAR